MLGGLVRILSPRHPMPQLPIPLISEARSDFFVSIFLICASLIRPSFPRGYGCLTLSKTPALFFLLSLKSSSRASGQTSPSVLFYSYFSQLRFFLEAVDKDALAFAIAPNASVCTPGLRNLSHFVDPPPETVFLSPPPLPSSLISLALVPQSFLSLSTKLSDDFDDDDSPSYPGVVPAPDRILISILTC